MKLHVINPNTSEEMTKLIRLSAQQAAGAETEIICTNLPHGPEYADCAYDNVLVSYELMQVIKENEYNACDAYVIASFADPALDAVRELTSKPVVGIAEAAIHFSAFLGHKFAIISTMPRMSKYFEDEVRRVCGINRLAAIKCPQYRISGFLNAEAEAKNMLVTAAKEAVMQDGAEVLILGGGVFAGYSEFLSQTVGVPVLDGVKCAVKMAEALVALGLRTSKAGTYAPPSEKNYIK